MWIGKHKPAVFQLESYPGNLLKCRFQGCNSGQCDFPYLRGLAEPNLDELPGGWGWEDAGTEMHPHLHQILLGPVTPVKPIMWFGLCALWVMPCIQDSKRDGLHALSPLHITEHLSASDLSVRTRAGTGGMSVQVLC